MRPDPWLVPRLALYLLIIFVTLHVLYGVYCAVYHVPVDNE